jgi:DNA-3-methyladenine glycosylase II
MGSVSTSHFVRDMPPLIHQLCHRSKTSFPSPEDVLTLDIPQLKSAGLSTRKAEYGNYLPIRSATNPHHLSSRTISCLIVLSLAEHFVSGKLSADFLQTASVEEVSKALIDIRGIGQVRTLLQTSVH